MKSPYRLPSDGFAATPTTKDYITETFFPLNMHPVQSTEIDPNGKSPNEAGAKLDAGKVCPSLIIEGMARALWGVAEVATFGMMKYTRDGWVSVSDGQFRYANAQYRHVLKRAMGETIDPDSELWHLKHEAWNALAKLDLAMREEETK